MIAARVRAGTRFAWERVIDFIKLHYCISDRDDSDFWRDNRDPAGIPDSLQENLALWRHQAPGEYDFSSKLEVFNLDNYLYVLYGMDYPTDLAPMAFRYHEGAAASERVRQHRRFAEQAAGQLLPHRELLKRIHQYGLQKI